MFKFNLREISAGISFLIVLISLHCYLVLVVSKWGLGGVRPTVFIVFVYFIANVLMVSCINKQLIPHLVIFLFWVFACLSDVIRSNAPLVDLIQTVFIAFIINVVFLMVCQSLIAKFMKALRAQKERESKSKEN
jgi:hypothetical protein